MATPNSDLVRECRRYWMDRLRDERPDLNRLARKERAWQGGWRLAYQIAGDCEAKEEES